MFIRTNRLASSVNRNGRSNPLKRAAQAAVELLEPRRFFSAAFDPATSTVNISGSESNDDIRVTVSSGNLSVSENGVITYTGAAASTKLISAYGNGGNDFISINAGAIPSYLDGGNGNDYLKGGPVNDQMYGQAGDDILYGNGGNDVMSGGIGNDQLHGGAGNDNLNGDDNDDKCWGDDGNDVVAGGNGNDQLFGGRNDDQLYGNAGNDVLVSIGGGQRDQLKGGAGFDSFWADSEATEVVVDGEPSEVAYSSIHRVASFYSYQINDGVTTTTTPVSRELDGQALADPIAGAPYASFSSKPLFSSYGPNIGDIHQGSVGDCWLMAGLASTANVSRTRIQQTVVDLGDGTYGVQFVKNGATQFIRVDGDLPVWNGTTPLYAKTGYQSCIWAPIIEKAWAFFRSDQGTYNSIASGNSVDVYWSMNANSDGTWNNYWSDASDLLRQLQAELSKGKAVTVATTSAGAIYNGAPLIGSHAYSVYKVNFDSTGAPVSVILRNPWGYDGAGSDSNVNDGYVTVTLAQVTSNLVEWESATV